MGRHGTQRGGGTRRALALTLIPLLLLAAVGGGYLWWTNRPTSAAAAQGPQPCAEPLQVLVAAELAPVAREVLSADGADGCRVAEVRSTASAQSAVQAIGTGQVPDVWVPDSSTWLDALPGSGDLPTAPDGWEQGPSVATSPVVLVSPTAGKSALAAAPTSWSDQVNVSGQVRMANPDTDTASRLAYYASRIDRPEALDLTVAGKLIFASRFAAASTQDQLAGLATTKDPLPFPASEQAAAAHAETAPGTLRTFVPQ
ncbi:MAG TPA: substrate-binding domain-containing protein, partial [Ornithinibacter sp.]|nr:substrate-binding domain-containing protein [Ornithinibacter sp.]